MLLVDAKFKNYKHVCDYINVQGVSLGRFPFTKQNLVTMETNNFIVI
jgi:hypothetical protein